MATALTTTDSLHRVKPSRRRQEDRTAEAKAAIRRAALELFATQGYEITTLAQISSHANFSRGLAQYHYRTKDVLVEELLEDAVAWQVHFYGLRQTEKTLDMDVIEQLVFQIESTARQMSIVFSGERAMEYRGLILLSAIATISANENFRQKVQESNRIVGGNICKALERGIAQGVVDKDVEPEGAAAFYIGGNWGLVNEFCAEPKHHKRVMQGFKTLAQAVEKWRA